MSQSGNDSNTKIVTTELSGSDLANLVESNDEQAMIQELEGAVINTCVYLNPKGKAVLNYAGIKEVMRSYGNIHLKVLRVECMMIKDWDPKKNIFTDKPCWVAQCSAHNLKANTTDEAIIFQSIYTEYGGINAFAAQMAISKAKRNAIKAVVPTSYLEKVIQSFLDQNKKPQTKKSTTSKSNQTKMISKPKDSPSTNKTTDKNNKQYKYWNSYKYLVSKNDQKAKDMIVFLKIVFTCGCKTEKDLFKLLSVLCLFKVIEISEVSSKNMLDWIIQVSSKNPLTEKLNAQDINKITHYVKMILNGGENNLGGSK